MTANRRSEGRGRDDAGFTVLELAVTVMIFGIVTAAFYNFLNNTMSITKRAQRDTQGDQAMVIALRTVTQDLRSASNVASCGAGTLYKSCLTLDIPRSQTVGLSCPSKTMTYTYSGTTLSQTEVDYSGSCVASTRWTNRPLLTTMANASSEALFTFYDGDGNLFDPDSTTYTAAQAATMVTTAGSIKAFVRITYGTVNAPTLFDSSIAALRNHR
jgi:prepilin-type N-terminal cleavage/methylation domain-containing protein